MFFLFTFIAQYLLYLLSSFLSEAKHFGKHGSIIAHCSVPRCLLLAVLAVLLALRDGGGAGGRADGQGVGGLMLPLLPSSLSRHR